MTAFLNDTLRKLAWVGAQAVIHRDVVTSGAIAAAFLLQTVLLLWTLRRLGRLTRETDRMRALTDAMALLTDTTESGLTTLIRAVERLNLHPAPARASRKSVARRVVAAAKQGEELSTIAGREALSESEVRLHLMLANIQAQKAAPERRSA